MTLQDLPSRYSNPLYFKIRNTLISLATFLKRLPKALIHDIIRPGLSINSLVFLACSKYVKVDPK